MKTLTKIKRIRKSFHSQLQPQKKTELIDLSLELETDEVLLIEDSSEQLPVVKKHLKIDPRQISNLPEEDRLKLRQEHLDMNEYFYMSARDKSKHFHLLNQKYRQQVKLAEPPGSAPMKKTIRFKKRFEIKPFSHQQKCDFIQKRKSFMELYKAKNEGKRKSLSKFPKNS